MDKICVLKLNLSSQDLENNSALSEKIDDFITKVSDRLCDKYNEEILFDSYFDKTDGTMNFTIDNKKALGETCKTIDKLFKDKKFALLNLKKVENKEFDELCN